MRIKVLRNLGRGLPDYTEGQEVDVEPEVAQALVERGLAERIEATLKAVPEAAAVKGVPPVEPAEGTDDQAEASMKAYKDRQKRGQPDGT